VHQPEVAFLDEVQERHAPVEIGLGDVDHQAQVVLDPFSAGRRNPGDGTPGKCSSSSGVNKRLRPI